MQPEGAGKATIPVEVSESERLFSLEETIESDKNQLEQLERELKRLEETLDRGKKCIEGVEENPIT